MRRLLGVAVLLVGCFATQAADRLEEARGLLGEGEAEAALAKAKAASESAEREQLLSEIHNRLGQHAEAVKAAKRGVKLAPKSADAHLAHAVAQRDKLMNGSRVKAMMGIGGYKKALRRALELDPDHVGAREEEIGYLLMAPGIAGGDKERALKRAEELSAIDARRGAAMRIDALLALERRDEAVGVMREILRAEPDDIPTRWRLGLQLQGAERWAEADREFQRIIDGEATEDRYRFAAVYQLGRSRVLGAFELEEAVAYFDRYLDEAPEGARGSEAGAHWRKGMALAALERRDEAAASYRRALELEPDHKQAKAGLAAL